MWIITLDRYTRAGLPECVIRAMSEPPSETTKDRTQTKDTHPVPGYKLTFLNPSESNPGPLSSIFSPWVARQVTQVKST